MRRLWGTAAVLLVVLGGCAHLTEPTIPQGQLGPQHLVATATAPTQVELRWDPVDGAGGYVLERRGVGGFAAIAAPSSPAFTDDQVEVGTAYTYRVRAQEQSAYSPEVSLTTPTAGLEAATHGYFAPPRPWPVVATHSGLLPDGRVWTAGGGGCGPCQKELGDFSRSHYEINRLSAEIYYPPYLFKPDGSLARRPTLVSAPQGIAYGSTFALEIAQPNNTIAKVTVNKLGSTTHAFNMGQHFVPLEFTPSGTNGLSVKAPESANIAPPGFYLLFVLDTNGVPSVAKIVKIG